MYFHDLPLEVVEHIGLYLNPVEYHRLRLSGKTGLLFQQLTRLSTLTQPGYFKKYYLWDYTDAYSGLIRIDTSYISRNSWAAMERMFKKKYRALDEIYLLCLSNLLQTSPAWFQPDVTALEVACFHNRMDLVQELIKVVDPSVQEQIAFRTACSRGHVELVRFLLQDPRIDPSAQSHFGLRVAADHGYLPIVVALLQNGHVDTHSCHIAICNACENGNTEVVRAFLQDPNVVAKARWSEILQYARRYRHQGIIRLLTEQCNLSKR
jgi:hypothetical protein